MLKNAPNKIYTFIPFVTGVILYSLYALISRMSFEYFAENCAEIMESGLSVGAAATVLYVIYEQFVRGRTDDTKIAAVELLLKGFVIEGSEREVAEEIVNTCSDAENHIELTLSEHAAAGVTQADIRLVAKLILRTLAI